jgi:hypothetical protein
MQAQLQTLYNIYKQIHKFTTSSQNFTQHHPSASLSSRLRCCRLPLAAAAGAAAAVSFSERGA